jgi:hypothetical protein
MGTDMHAYNTPTLKTNEMVILSVVARSLKSLERGITCLVHLFALLDPSFDASCLLV